MPLNLDFLYLYKRYQKHIRQTEFYTFIILYYFSTIFHLLRQTNKINNFLYGQVDT